MSHQGATITGIPSGFRYDRLSVLLVDDNRHMLNLMSEILRGLSIRQITKLANPVDAFREMMIMPVDIVVIDFAMEMLDGVEFTKLVRQGKDSPDAFMPIIMVTGYSDAHTVRLARDAGVTEFLAKPISATALFARVLEVINNPRPFIRCNAFFGPDRRRHQLPFDGPDRRVEPPREEAEADFRLFPAQRIEV